jgi:hypothetical protein
MNWRIFKMLKIEIETGNSATNNDYDLSVLLKTIAKRIENSDYIEDSNNSIMDYNGNKVGFFKVEY